MIERVHIAEHWPTGGHRVVVLGRAMPGAPASWLKADGTWEPVTENSHVDDTVGFQLPEGALDAIVAAAHATTTAQPATERHLKDTIAVRDRLLALVEKDR